MEVIIFGKESYGKVGTLSDCLNRDGEVVITHVNRDVTGLYNHWVKTYGLESIMIASKSKKLKLKHPVIYI